jgi:hypothetical protein
VRLHPITIGLRALRGERSIHGRRLPDAAEAVALLRQFTGQGFGQDAAWASGQPLGLQRRTRRATPNQGIRGRQRYSP